MSLPNNQRTADELVKLLFCRVEGMGFTILRNRIPFRERLAGDYTPNHNDGFVIRRSDNTYDYAVNADGSKTFNLNWNNWDLSGTRRLIRQIKDLGERGPEELVLFSAPWTPPNNRVTRWKEDVAGVSAQLDYTIDWSRPDIWGRLRRDKYEDYADLLADYVKNFETNMGAPLNILSIQNEPNWKVEYESCYWDGIDLRDFLNIVAQRFPAKGIALGNSGGLGIMIPEFENFNVNFDEMIKPSLDSPEAQRILTHIALHQYNGAFDPTDRAGAKPFPEILATGKRFWQTEVSGSGPHLPRGVGIENALYYARMIHFDFTLVEMNAFLFWWLWRNDDVENFTGSLINVINGNTLVPAKRLYAMGQFSRFIRPGWRRIESDTEPREMVYSSAYRNPDTNEIVIVLINDRLATFSFNLELADASFTRLDSWRTSATENMAPLGRQRTSGNSANVTLPPKSITTFYGLVRPQ
jgi:O-glycosyl hydrolase